MYIILTQVSIGSLHVIIIYNLSVDMMVKKKILKLWKD